MEVSIDGKRREILNNSSISPEILSLGRTTTGRIYEEESPFFCSSSSYNFVGSLLVHLHRNEFEAAINKRKKFTIGELTTPVSIFRTNATIYDHVHIGLLDTYPSLQDSSLKNLDLTLLTKYACGWDLSLITTGPLAGLFISTSRHKRARYGVERVWNDEPRPKSYTPYRSRIVPYFAMSKRSYQRIDKKAHDLFFEYLEPFGDEMLSTILFSLCQQANIPVDENLFHTTISV